MDSEKCDDTMCSRPGSSSSSSSTALSGPSCVRRLANPSCSSHELSWSSTIPANNRGGTGGTYSALDRQSEPRALDADREWGTDRQTTSSMFRTGAKAATGFMLRCRDGFLGLERRDADFALEARSGTSRVLPWAFSSRTPARRPRDTESDVSATKRPIGDARAGYIALELGRFKLGEDVACRRCGGKADLESFDGVSAILREELMRELIFRELGVRKVSGRRVGGESMMKSAGRRGRGLLEVTACR